MATGILPFLDDTRAECADAGVKLKLVAKTVLDKEQSIGFFDDEKPELAAACLLPNWPLIIAHERGHLQQWKAGKFLNSPAFDNFGNWLYENKRLSKRRLLSAVRHVQRCELDAERRAVKLIRKFKLGDVELYIQRANAYIWAHEVARKTRQWPKCAIHEIPGLTACTPKKLIRLRDIGKVPQAVESIIIAAF